MTAPVPYCIKTKSAMKIGTLLPLIVFIAYEPVKTPVLSLSVESLSISEYSRVVLMYFSTFSLFSGVVSSDTKSCSGAKTIKVTPKRVAILVVKVSISGVEICK